MARQPGRPALTKADYERLAEFRRLLRQFVAFSEHAARAAGLTVQHHQALLAIKGFPGRERVTVGELADRLGIRSHSAGELVNRLAERKLVRRRTDAPDRRQVMIEITAAAERLLEELTAAHRDELRRIAPLFAALLGEDGPSPTPPTPADIRD
jgi:DNA-binding MarR family transcriptional regulator